MTMLMFYTIKSNLWSNTEYSVVYHNTQVEISLFCMQDLIELVELKMLESIVSVLPSYGFHFLGKPGFS